MNTELVSKNNLQNHTATQDDRHIQSRTKKKRVFAGDFATVVWVQILSPGFGVGNICNVNTRGFC
jgi:hypothetical protein